MWKDDASVRLTSVYSALGWNVWPSTSVSAHVRHDDVISCPRFALRFVLWISWQYTDRLSSTSYGFVIASSQLATLRTSQLVPLQPPVESSASTNMSCLSVWVFNIRHWWRRMFECGIGSDVRRSYMHCVSSCAISGYDRCVLYGIFLGQLSHLVCSAGSCVSSFVKCIQRKTWKVLEEL